ncbi:heat shock 70 kDa protein 1-like [Rosa chinensis]|uniref:heat shock 70 kDa protein 1-like n=1 Tax=Rosa chinensis TaxID=74649 RepID=UPI000D08838D|nr:heat shock 70 kDa protein 1-like [Rosa chinensis]
MLCSPNSKHVCRCIYIQFDGTITRDKFDQLNWDLYDQCVKLVDKCLDDAAMDATSVSDVLLLGCSPKVPMLQELVRVYFRVRGIQVSINREEKEPVVAYGASLVGAMLCTASIKEVQYVSIDL